MAFERPWADQTIVRAASAIAGAEALMISAGAGMGVDSGLPDFRGPEGFWKAYPAYRGLGLHFMQLANPRWFRDDPALAWGFYGHRLGLYRATVPHAGFAVLRKWAGRMKHGARVFTSNVDGQFQAAGFGEEGIIEAHGSIHWLQCAEGCAGIWEAAGTEVAVEPETFRAIGELPRCRTCGGMARPNILMFDDFGWLEERAERQEASLQRWLASMSEVRMVVVECGAGTAIPTVRHFSERTAAGIMRRLIRINAREAAAPPGHLGFEGGALEVLRAIDEVLELAEWRI